VTLPITVWRGLAGMAALALLSGCAHVDRRGHPQPSTASTVDKRTPPSDSVTPPSDGVTPRSDVTGAASAPTRPADANPLTGYRFYVEPGSRASVQVTQWEAQGRADDARQLSKISSQPTARWLTTGSPTLGSDVNALVGRAAQAHEMPVLVAYYIPHRDCGSYSAGGAPSASAYRDWVRALARGIGNRPATVIVEPDAVAHIADGCIADPTERYDLLRDAVSTLKAAGSTRVYLDAGHPSWIKDVAALADALRRAGIDAADGFALNVANFVTIDDNVSYGRNLSDALGGAHFVIDTSRNGAGPPAAGTLDGGPSWCNPSGRGLGHVPTSQTDLPGVDALLWVKHPGDSDGACRPGEPLAGQWWPEYALALARHTP
jgi:endoglucanase